MTKNTLLTLGGMTLLGVGIVSGLALTTSAQIADTDTNSVDTSEVADARGSRRGRRGARLTEEEREEKQATREAIESALESNDYAAWQAAVAETPIGDYLLETIDTEDEFNQVVEAYNLDQKAESILEELGIDRETIKEEVKGELHREDEGAEEA
jgi:SOS response regulatory protein OraA/RecX